MIDRERIARIHSAVSEGESDVCRRLAEEALLAGADPLRLLEDCFMRALQAVGSRWEAGEIFLPEMILAAEAMKAAMQVLQPRLGGAGGRALAPRRCVLGTVQGDIHDIGKSIVGALLEAAGFEVLDLGTDVGPERFVSAVKEWEPGFVGMSAMLTTTMSEMGTVLGALEEAGLRSRVRAAVGGAPVTQEFADEIGADGYAQDGLGAMRLFRRLAGEAVQAGVGPGGSGG